MWDNVRRVYRTVSLKTIGLHLIASIFIIAAFRQYSSLMDIPLLQSINEGETWNELDSIHTNMTLGEVITTELWWQWRFTLIAISLLFVTTLFLYIKLGRGWVNSVILLVLNFSLLPLRFFKPDVVHSILFFPANLFPKMPVEWTFTLNASILMTIGFAIFYFSFRWGKIAE